MSDLHYPIGRFAHEGDFTPEDRTRWMKELDELPARLRAAVGGLSDAQLDTPYRSGGWTVRQVVHHLADSHMVTYARCRLALTEDRPEVKGYSAGLWADLPDARSGELEPSLRLLESLHARWIRLLGMLTPTDFERQFVRPDGQVHSLNRTLGAYAWHGRHHVAHITSLRERMGWK